MMILLNNFLQDDILFSIHGSVLFLEEILFLHILMKNSPVQNY